MIGYVASESPKSQAVSKLLQKLNFINILEEDNPRVNLLIVVGGDGFMLRVLHNYVIEKNENISVYGINTGNVGFLMNQPEEDIMHCIKHAVSTQLILLKMEATDINNKKYYYKAINEVHIFRQTNQIVEISVIINGKLKIEKLRGDGIILSTPVGSPAYNFAAGGPVVPLDSNLLALTSINSYYPKYWNGALISNNTVVELDIHDVENRPAIVVSDYKELHNISHIKIAKDQQSTITILFDKEYPLDARILDRQFA
ncbi:NAD kinase [Wolbachia pipientis]|uniref:NAD kinase n=1 Tax=Wolbachia pipientis TaxID=955 RepID=A0A1E7QL12_WOLPI|nr:NAD kinase [Wolbachia pipientis]OEY87036.1 NAD kinase [Wolbachia pipientis]